VHPRPPAPRGAPHPGRGELSGVSDTLRGEADYGYDAKGRLLNDALGRRTHKIVTTTHGTTDTRFLWQGYRLLQEQQESGLCST
ncbi:hypothetical protein LDK53_22935, partial [Enterobacter sp. K16B]|nr:hypothetical protein [Enterobacter sp. K16B]